MQGIGIEKLQQAYESLDNEDQDSVEVRHVYALLQS